MPWSNRKGFAFSRPSIITNAPSQSGIYGLYKGQQWIYFGESGNIRERLLADLGGDNDYINRLRPTNFSFELHPENQRVERQNQLILEYHPPCNQKLG